MPELLLPCLYAFLACLGFCVLFRIRGPGAVLCALGGALAWLVYLLTGPLVGENDLIQSFLAAVFLSAYSEVMARVRKCPATGYLLIAFIPLVPGAGIYNMMDAALRGEQLQPLLLGQLPEHTAHDTVCGHASSHDERTRTKYGKSAARLDHQSFRHSQQIRGRRITQE